jgi:16S rRNA (cytosine967-C5)-methyltransferase
MKPVQSKPSAKAKPHARVSPARRAAFEILRRVASEGAYASVLLAQLTELSREDRALAAEITLGVLRHQKTLDYFIERYTRRRLQKLDLPVVIALRLGLYQIRFLSRIPQSAAVNESVNLVKLARKTSAAGMVNAALRQAARNPHEALGEALGEPFEHFAVALSHPSWLLARWAAIFGEGEMQRLATANNQVPETAFRVNTLLAKSEEILARIEAEGLHRRPSRIADGAFVLEGSKAALLAPLVDEGLIYIQDEASQLVSLLLDARPGQSILDLCAAPGSKTSHLAAFTNNQATIIACDLHTHRLATLAVNCRRLGATSVTSVVADATKDLPFAESVRFDRVLIDAPCTGTGTLRRNPEIKWRLTPEDSQRLSVLQSALLANAARALLPNGRLVYSTCSIEPQENEAVIERFLESHTGYKLVMPKSPADCLTREGFCRTFPHTHGTDGFFAAVIEKSA